MITMYIDKRAIDKKDKFINTIDLAFDKEIYSLNITTEDEKALQIIDNAEYIGNGYINTPFGRTEIQNLSTGCKTLILLNHAQELGNPIINIGECGKNVLDKVFKMDNIRIYIDYCSIPNEYDYNKMVHVIAYKGSKKMSLHDIFNKLGRKGYNGN